MPCSVSCNNGNNPDTYPGDHNQNVVGRVYGSMDSVYAPIWVFFRDMRRTHKHYLPSEASTSIGLRAQRGRESNARPCILLRPHPELGVNCASVYLMATYTNTPLSEMPLVFQHFSIAVHTLPHAESTTPQDHLHSMPEWSGVAVQWVIALEYNTRTLLPGQPWSAPNGQQYIFGGQAMEYLMKCSDQKRQSWQTMCQKDGTFLAAQVFQLKVSMSHLADIWT